MPRPCRLCCHPDQNAVEAALASGASDRELAKRFGTSHMAVHRHRREHVVKPLQLAAAALDKRRAVRERRQELVNRTEQGDPTAIFQLGAIAADLARIANRLDAAAQEAADGGQHSSHAALASQLLRSLEVRSKLGGHDRPTPSASEGQPFSINILFSSGEKLPISSAPQVGQTDIIDRVADEEDPPGEHGNNF